MEEHTFDVPVFQIEVVSVVSPLVQHLKMKVFLRKTGAAASEFDRDL